MGNTMSNPTSQFIKNGLVDKMLSWIPDDPLTQSQYLYYLSGIIFLGLLVYALTSWYNLFTQFALKTLFAAMFMSAICLMTTFGFKSTRANYLAVKAMMSQKPQDVKIESVDDMLEGFKK